MRAEKKIYRGKVYKLVGKFIKHIHLDNLKFWFINDKSYITLLLPSKY
jgi:hypothetical protein